MRTIQLAVSCAAVLIATMGQVQGGVIVSENFESYSNSGLIGNSGNNWKVIPSHGGGNFNVQSTNSGGSFSGKTIKSDGLGANGTSTSYRHDGFNYLSASDTEMTLSFTSSGAFSRFGVGYWNGTSFNYGLLFGSDGNRWAAWTSNAAGNWIQTAATSNNLWNATTIRDLRLTVDLVNKTGTFEIKNPGSNWQTPTGMSNFSLSLLGVANANARNPLNWNAMAVRSLGNGDVYDNLSVSSIGSIAAVPEPTSLAVFGLGACIAGIGSARRRRREKHHEATA